jgi:DNA-binding transcriptional ArsR family regulator
MNDTAVSHALRLLRANGLVSADRDGRIIRYRLSDPSAADILAQVAPGPLTGNSVPIVDTGG